MKLLRCCCSYEWNSLLPFCLWDLPQFRQVKALQGYEAMCSKRTMPCLLQCKRCVIVTVGWCIYWRKKKRVITNYSSLISRSHAYLVPLEAVNMCVESKPRLQRFKLTHTHTHTIYLQIQPCVHKQHGNSRRSVSHAAQRQLTVWGSCVCVCTKTLTWTPVPFQSFNLEGGIFL